MEPVGEFAMLARVHRRRHLLRTAQLNAAGWVAVAAAALLTGLLLAVIGSWLGWPAWLGVLLGPPAVLLVLVVLDRRRDRRGYMSFAWTEDEGVVWAAAVELGQRGVAVTVLTAEDEPPSLRFRRRDERLVTSVLGLPSR
jgi:hypothetical protein